CHAPLAHSGPPRPTTPPLFPYTTLFRSGPSECSEARSERPSRRATRLGAARGRTAGQLRSLLRVRGFVEEHQKRPRRQDADAGRSEEHTSELQSRVDLVCRLLLEKKKGR